MNHATKKEIQLLTKQFVEACPSQNQAATRLDINAGTLINLLNEEYWPRLSDDMWRKVGKQVGYKAGSGAWVMVETKGFTNLRSLFNDSRINLNTYAIVGNTGTGKSKTAEYEAKHVDNTYHLECAEYWNKKQFLGELLRVMGKENTGLNIGDMMETIVETVMKQEAPLIILDEADKLADPVLYFFITLYNRLRNKCGLIIMATEFLEKRIERGRRLNKKGYAEIFSRIGRRFITIKTANKDEVKAICEANGLTDPLNISSVYNDFEGDLRRLERMVHKYSLQANNAKAA